VIIDRIDYCQFLRSSRDNFAMTNFADQSRGFSHGAMSRLLRRDKLTGGFLWEHVRGDMVQSARGCFVFDDSILNKEVHSHAMELVRLQCSGNAHGLIKGIGMVNCLYVNPDTGQYWIVDYRLFNPDGDGKTKLNHVQEMLTAAPPTRRCPLPTCCSTVGTPPKHDAVR